jgi:hypothetical protein
VAIEFAGNLRSVDGRRWRPDTYGRNVLTPAQVDAERRLLRLLSKLGVRFVFGHRQSYSERGMTRDRRSGPVGEAGKGGRPWPRND